MNSGITVLSYFDRIACFHSLTPFLFSRERKRFRFTNDPEECLRRDKNKVLVMMRWFLKPDVFDEELMKRLRDKYERIAFFHDMPGGGIYRFEALPYVDLFYHKALFKDRSVYTRSLYGNELFSDYYHGKYGVVDGDETPRAVLPSLEGADKLRLYWNIGIGDFPRETLRQRTAIAASRYLDFGLLRWFYRKRRFPEDVFLKNSGRLPVHARLGVVNKPSIAKQRQLILDRVAADERFIVGEVPQKQYNEEIKNSKIILSPFGWGELCFRDFEAILSGALLLKPDMSHLETWPDVFVPDETYVPITWDADDLVEKTDRYLRDDAERLRIAKNAYESYRDQVRGLDDRFEKILAEIEG